MAHAPQPGMSSPGAPDPRRRATPPVPAGVGAGDPVGGGRGGRGAPGLRLYGVVSLAAPGALAVDGAASSARARLHTPPLGTPAAEVVRVRDLGAVVAAARYAPEGLTAELVRGYRAVVESVFADRAVLPAPPGAVFRSRAALTAWMELHAGALAEGLRFVEDRAEARVTAVGPPVAALEAFTALRREAAAMLVLRDESEHEAPPGATSAQATVEAPEAPAAPVVDAGAVDAESCAAFLVDRGRWSVFTDAVAREAGHRLGLRLACAGPWPPYSFVRLDFHA